MAASQSPSWNGMAWNQLTWNGPLGSAASLPPLLLTATLSARLIPTPAPASWTTIDPDRTQEMAPKYGT